MATWLPDIVAYCKEGPIRLSNTHDLDHQEDTKGHRTLESH